MPYSFKDKIMVKKAFLVTGACIGLAVLPGPQKQIFCTPPPSSRFSLMLGVSTCNVEVVHASELHVYQPPEAGHSRQLDGC